MTAPTEVESPPRHVLARIVSDEHGHTTTELYDGPPGGGLAPVIPIRPAQQRGQGHPRRKHTPRRAQADRLEGRYLDLGARDRLVLVNMARLARLDRARGLWLYRDGWPVLAVGCGWVESPETMTRAATVRVSRAVAALCTAGAVERLISSGNGRRAVYRVDL
jgi:hypothetical protein